MPKKQVFDSFLDGGYEAINKNDYDRAILLGKKAYEIADTYLQKSFSSQALGEFYLKKHEWTESAHWLLISIEFGNPKSMCLMGWLHYHDYLNEPLFHKNLAHDYFIRSARGGFNEGYYGLFLLENKYDYLAECRKKGYEPPMYNGKYISPLEYEPKSSEKDSLDKLYDESKEGNRKSFETMINRASKGDAEACHYVGLFLEETAQSPEAIDLALKWYNKGSALGNKSSERKKRLISGYSRNKEDICPRCQLGLVIRPAPNGGYFKGCPNYPRCRYTAPVSTPIYNGRKQVTEWDCFRTYMKKK